MRRRFLWLALCACATPTSTPPTAPAASTAAQAAAAPGGAAHTGTDAAASTPAGTHELAQQILSRPELAPYHGWISYLQFRARHGAERKQDAAASAQDQQRLI